MPNFYLDIETTGLDPKKDKIITIQFQELERNTGKPVGELIILKEWESSEKEIIQEFITKSNILDPYVFSFIAVGYNLFFENNFLKKRAEIHNLPTIDLFSLPFIDLRSLGILMNRGEFKGTKLSDLTGKKESGLMVLAYYDAKRYQYIIDYIKQEAEEFGNFAQFFYQKMPELREELKDNFL